MASKLRSIQRVFNKLHDYIKNHEYKGWDPYDLLNSNLLCGSSISRKILLLMTQLNRISPVNLRTIYRINKGYNSKAMALLLSALLNNENPLVTNEANELKNWLTANKSRTYEEYSIGFTFDIVLQNYTSVKSSPSLVITLFASYALFEYWRRTKKEEILALILSFHKLIEDKLPHFENSDSVWYSYNFEKVNEIYNSTAKIGKYYALLYSIKNDETLLSKMKRMLNYLKRKQRNDGSWAYGEKISYTDGFHTAFVLEAIWYMRKVVDNEKYEMMFDKGLKHYKKCLFKPNGQPLYFHPKYKPKDIRRYLIETDIRDCAMAIVLFSKIGEKILAKKVLDWTLKNMYNPKKGYFYYYKNKLWTNKIEFIRWQAWMLYALSVYNQSV